MHLSIGFLYRTAGESIIARDAARHSAITGLLVPASGRFAVAASAFPLGFFSAIANLKIEQDGLEERQKKERQTEHRRQQDDPEHDFEDKRRTHHRQDKIEGRKKDHDQKAHEESRAIRRIGNTEILATARAFIAEFEIGPEQATLPAPRAALLQTSFDRLLEHDGRYETFRVTRGVWQSGAGGSGSQRLSEHIAESALRAGGLHRHPTDCTNHNRTGRVIHPVPKGFDYPWGSALAFPRTTEIREVEDGI